MAQITFKLTDIQSNVLLYNLILQKLLTSGEFKPIRKSLEEITYEISDEYISINELIGYQGAEIKLEKIDLWIEVSLNVLSQGVPEIFPNRFKEDNSIKTWEEFNEPIRKNEKNAILTVKERDGRNFKSMSHEIYVAYQRTFGTENFLTKSILQNKLDLEYSI